MKTVLVEIRSKLTKTGLKDINLWIRSTILGRSSPCGVITNGVQTTIGGTIPSLGWKFEQELTKCPGYKIVEYEEITAQIPEEQNTDLNYDDPEC